MFLFQASQFSKKEVEDLLKKGAYGAVMDSDNEGDQFCEEDIDAILQRRTQVIQIESEGKGSTFSKVRTICILSVPFGPRSGRMWNTLLSLRVFTQLQQHQRICAQMQICFRVLCELGLTQRRLWGVQRVSCTESVCFCL